MCVCVGQADVEPAPRQPSKYTKPAPPPPPPPAVSPRPSSRQSAAGDLHIVTDTAGTDTIRQSFEPPPPVTHVVADAAGSDTIRESFEPPRSPLTHVVDDSQPQVLNVDQQVVAADSKSSLAYSLYLA